MRIRTDLRRIVGLAFVSSLLLARTASAEVVIGEASDWKLSIEGRLNSFLSYSFGDARPRFRAEDGNTGLVEGGGLDQQLQSDANNHISTPRIRNGFVGNVITFNLRRNVTESTTLLARLSLWSDIETNLQRYSDALAWMQEGYMKLEGPWGSFLAGRALGLMSRGAVEIDYNYAHGFGLGYPCNIDQVHPTCGMIGFGVMFPFFASGLVYETPSLGGLTVTVGAYDPVILAGKWERVMLPRFEGEVAFTKKLGSLGMFKLFGNGLWERVGHQSDSTDTKTIARKTVDAYGVSGGGRLELGPVRLGFVGHYGKGLGFYYPLEDSQAAFYNATDTSTDKRDGDLRTFRGYFGQMMLVLGKVSIGGGAGVSQLIPLSFDDTVATPLPKQNLGIDAVLWYRVTDYLVLDLDFFRSQFTWWSTSAHQNVNFVNSGITVMF